VNLNKLNCQEMKTMLSKDEWDELVALKNAISYNPASVSTEKQELFTELLIRSFENRGIAFEDPQTISLEYAK